MKLLKMLLAIIVLNFTLLCTFTFAAPDIDDEFYISIDSPSGTLGNPPVAVSINLSRIVIGETDDISGIYIKLSYDKSVLEVDDVEIGGIIPGPDKWNWFPENPIENGKTIFSADEVNGEVTFVLFDTSATSAPPIDNARGIPLPSGDGVVANVMFNVKGAGAGFSALTINQGDVYLLYQDPADTGDRYEFGEYDIPAANITPGTFTRLAATTYDLTVTSVNGTIGKTLDAGAEVSWTYNDATDTYTGVYLEDAEVTLTASPDPGGFAFTGWTGSGFSGTGDITVTMDSDKTITANFAITPVITFTGAPLDEATVSSQTVKIEGSIANFGDVDRVNILVTSDLDPENTVDVDIDFDNLTGSFTTDGIPSYQLFEYGNSIDVTAYDASSIQLVRSSFTVNLYRLELSAPSVTLGDDITLTALTDDTGERTVVLYEWDFDSKGIIDLRSDEGSDENEVEHAFTSIGPHTVTVRVMDEDGIIQSNYISLTTGAKAGEDPPVIDSVAVDVNSGTAPLIVELTAETSLGSADTTIVSYEWDFDNNGVYDSYSEASPNIVTTYTISDAYNPVLKITDSEGLTATSDTLPLVIDVLDSASSPDINLIIDEQALPVVAFTVQSSAQDIKRFEWDFDGDSICDKVTFISTVDYTYRRVGIFTASVLVTTDKNISAKDFGDVVINTSAFANHKKISWQEEPQGDIPLDVEFGPKIDIIPDTGDVDIFRFDFDGDGRFDLTTNAADKDVTHTYYEPGNYYARVLMINTGQWHQLLIVKIKARRFPLGRISIVAPKNGKILGGDKATLVPRLSPRLRHKMISLRFQYSASGTGVWNDIGEEITERPFISKWDISGFVNGDDYDLRCRVTTDDIDPIYSPAITVTISDIDPDITETVDAVTGETTKEQKFTEDASNEVILNDGTKVSLPSHDMITTSGVTLTLQTLDLSSIPEIPEDPDSPVSFIGTFRGIKVDGISPVFSNDAGLTIPYDTIALGDVDEKTLKVFYLNETAQPMKWEEIFGSSVYTSEKIVKAKTHHFSIFGLGFLGGSDGDGSGGGGLISGDDCFIATAAYGTPMANEVKILSEFRDEYLLKNSIGKKLVKLYYRTSPPAADYIRTNPYFRAVIRTLLRPVVKITQKILR